MKLKSTTYYWLAVVFGGVGMGAAMGAEGTAQTGGAINGNTFTTAAVLVLLGLLCMKLGFLTQDREEREGKGGRYGKITRNHARNPEYPENQERGA